MDAVWMGCGGMGWQVQRIVSGMCVWVGGDEGDPCVLVCVHIVPGLVQVRHKLEEENAIKNGDGCDHDGDSSDRIDDDDEEEEEEGRSSKVVGVTR